MFSNVLVTIFSKLPTIQIGKNQKKSCGVSYKVHQAIPNIDCIYQSYPLSSATQNTLSRTGQESLWILWFKQRKERYFTNDLVQKLMFVNSLIKSFNHDYPHQIWKHKFTCYQSIENCFVIYQILGINQWIRNIHSLLESRYERVKFYWFYV